jgi:hypothetical protein
MVSCPRLSAVTGSYLSRLRLYEWERALPYSQHGPRTAKLKNIKCRTGPPQEAECTIWSGKAKLRGRLTKVLGWEYSRNTRQLMRKEHSSITRSKPPISEVPMLVFMHG